MSEQDAHNLTDVLEQILRKTNGESITFGEILDTFGARAFGPMLLVPAIIAVGPTGAIPGMSLFTGAIIASLSIQIAFSQSSPWLPQSLRRWTVSRNRLAAFIERVRPLTKKVDVVLRPRLTALTTVPVVQIVAIVCIVMAASMFPLALMPFAVAVPGSAVALIALGITARDGAIVIAGLVVALVTLGLFWFGLREAMTWIG